MEDLVKGDIGKLLEKLNSPCVKKSTEELLEIEKDKFQRLEHLLYKIEQVLYGSKDLKDIAEIVFDPWIFDHWVEHFYKGSNNENLVE